MELPTLERKEGNGWLMASGWVKYLELLRDADHTRFHFHRGDLTDPAACEEGVRTCRAVFGYVLSLCLSVSL